MKKVTNISDQAAYMNPEHVAYVVDFGDYVAVYLVGQEKAVSIKGSLSQFVKDMGF